MPMRSREHFPALCFRKPLLVRTLTSTCNVFSEDLLVHVSQILRNLWIDCYFNILVPFAVLPQKIASQILLVSKMFGQVTHWTKQMPYGGPKWSRSLSWSPDILMTVLVPRLAVPVGSYLGLGLSIQTPHEQYIIP